MSQRFSSVSELCRRFAWLGVGALMLLLPAPARGDEPSVTAAPTPSVEAEAPATEVTVAGTRVTRLPGSAHVLTEKQLERQERDDAQAILQQVPGVYVRQEDGIGLRPNIGIRGANPDRSKKITLMEDGILFGPAPYSAPAAYYFPLMTRMTYVRVTKGPSAIAYGPHTVGGAIDFVSRPIPEQTSGAVDLAVGEYGYSKVHAYAGTRDTHLGYLLEGVHLHDSGFKKLPSGADTGSTRNDFMAKLTYVLDPTARETHELGVKLSYADEVSNETYLGLTDADFRRDPYQRYAASALDQMRNHRTSIVLSHAFEAPRRSFTMKTQAYRHDYARTWRKVNHFRGAGIAGVLRDPTDPVNAPFLTVLRGESDTDVPGKTLLIGPNEREFVSEGVQQVLSLGVDTGPVGHRLELGLRLHHDQIRRLHTESPFSMIGGELLPEEAPVELTAANLASTTALALHVADAATWGALTLTPGARVEIVRSSLDDQLEGTEKNALVRAFMPGIGAYYGLTDALGVLAGAYRGFSPPSPGGASAGDPDDNRNYASEPEYSVNYEAGVRYSATPRRAELIGFYNDYTNLTDVCTLASGCRDDDLDRQFDAGRARIYGLEVYLADELRLTETLRLPFHGSYTFTRANFQQTFSSQDPIWADVKRGDELPYVPRHQLAATVALEHERAGGYATATYVSSMREEAGQAPISQELVTDEQFLLDLGVSGRVLKFLSLYANLRNALGGQFIVSRRPYGARPNAPRWLQVGAKVAF
jgi:Fe(3+) dicitrate transport protein